MFSWIKKYFLLFLFFASVSNSAEDAALTAANGLFQSQNYFAAVTEYKRFIFFNPNNEHIWEAYHRIGLAYRCLAQWDKAIETFQTESDLTEDERLRDEMKLNIALTMIASKDYVSAELQLSRLILFSQNPYTKKKAEYFMGVVYLYKYQWNDARIYFYQYFDSTSSTVANRIDSLLNSESLPKNKSTSIAILVSSILPGSGQFYAEQYGDGVNGLFINTATGFLMIQSIIEQRYQDAVIAFFPIFYRYYEGNRLNAEREIIQYNKKVNSEYLNIVLKSLLPD